MRDWNLDNLTKAAELVNEYKKQHSAENGKDNNKSQTYYIVVKNSQKQGR